MLFQNSPSIIILLFLKAKLSIFAWGLILRGSTTLSERKFLWYKVIFFSEWIWYFQYIQIIFHFRIKRKSSFSLTYTYWKMQLSECNFKKSHFSHRYKVLCRISRLTVCVTKKRVISRHESESVFAGWSNDFPLFIPLCSCSPLLWAGNRFRKHRAMQLKAKSLPRLGAWMS